MMLFTGILLLLLLSSTCYSIFISDDPDAFLTAPEMIMRQGYPVETYHVNTSDGYILSMFRIPHNKVSQTIGKPLIMVHGLQGSPDEFLLQGYKSIAYLLSDEGYDVWLGCVRGHHYSKNHTHYSTLSLDPRFWDFSFWQIGYIDVPRMIDFILNEVKKTALYYIGHSQGTTALFTMLSERPSYNQKIIAAVALAPEVYLRNAQMPLFPILKTFGSPVLAPAIYPLTRIEVLTHTGLTGLVGQFCSSLLSVNILPSICEEALGLLFGPPCEPNTTTLAHAFYHFPTNSSLQCLIHYLQLIFSDKFQRYDYGALMNLEKHNSLTPPRIPLEKVTAPIYLFYSYKDYLSHPVDVKRLFNEISSQFKEMVLVKEGCYNHVDYVIANSSPTEVAAPIIERFGRHV